MKVFRILLTIAFMSGAGIAVAQSGETDNREKLRFGLRAGLNYSNVYDSQTEEFRADAKIGLAGGALVSIPITKYIGVQPEILISQKGFRGEGRLLGQEYNFTRTTTFIDIPLQVALKPSEFITIVAGPQFSYLIKQKDEFTSTIFSYSQEQEIKNDNVRRNILGIGGGLDITLRNLLLSSRLGLDLSRNHGDGTSDTPRYKNVWFQATVGFNI